MVWEEVAGEGASGLETLIKNSLARDFIFAPEDSFCHWKTIMGLDLQNLVNQAQYLSKFDQKVEKKLPYTNSKPIVNLTDWKTEQLIAQLRKDFGKKFIKLFQHKKGQKKKFDVPDKKSCFFP